MYELQRVLQRECVPHMETQYLMPRCPHFSNVTASKGRQ